LLLVANTGCVQRTCCYCTHCHSNWTSHY